MLTVHHKTVYCTDPLKSIPIKFDLKFKQIKKINHFSLDFDQQVTLNKILIHKSGLTSIGSCIVSNLVRSRIIALEVRPRNHLRRPISYTKFRITHFKQTQNKLSLFVQILTRICNVQPEGYSKVLEAMTIMRILFGKLLLWSVLDPQGH